ncbi:MAG: hypothetical protein Q9169_002220 [Polycauliona sp. 2 TL-2023]
MCGTSKACSGERVVVADSRSDAPEVAKRFEKERPTKDASAAIVSSSDRRPGKRPRQQGSRAGYHVNDVDDASARNIFLFEKLPGEIRNTVYRYLLRCDRVDRITIRRARNDRAAVHQPLRQKYQFTLSILRVNRKTYQEATHILYEENQWVLYSETRAILCQNLVDLCFPSIRLRQCPESKRSNCKLACELEVQIRHKPSDKKMASWFIVSRADAAEVSRFILTDKALLLADHYLIFNADNPIKKSSFVSVFDGLHGMISVRVGGVFDTRTRNKLYSSMKSKRQAAKHWIMSGQAWLSRGVLNIEEFTRRGKVGMNYKAAMESFGSGWSEMLEAPQKIESGELICDASQQTELQKLQIRFADAMSKYCARDDISRDAHHVLTIRASLRRFLESSSKAIEVDDLLQIFLNMARDGLNLQDHELALYALAEALGLRPGLSETQGLLTQLNGSVDRSWRNASFGVQGLFKELFKARSPSIVLDVDPAHWK